MAREPNDIASRVHVERDSLGAQSEGHGVVAAGVQREGDLAALAEAGGGVGGGGLEEVGWSCLGSTGFGEGVC